MREVQKNNDKSTSYKHHTEPHDKYKFFTLSIHDPLWQLWPENLFGLKKNNETKKKDKDLSTTWPVSLDMKYKVRISRKLLPLKSRGTMIVLKKQNMQFFDSGTGIYTAKHRKLSMWTSVIAWINRHLVAMWDHRLELSLATFTIKTKQNKTKTHLPVNLYSE